MTAIAENSLTVGAHAEGQDLTATLERLRTVVSGGWTRQTAYPGSLLDDQWAPGDPRGQCGVSATWLAEYLANHFGIEATFCRGSLLLDDHTEAGLSDHCWLELLDPDGETLILDLTCDQTDGLNGPVVLEAKTGLARKNVRFVTRFHFSRHELREYTVWARYLILESNLRGNYSLTTGAQDAGLLARL